MNKSLNILIDEKAIAAKVKELATEIREEFPQDETIKAICVLKGSVIFFSDLTRALGGDIRYEFVKVSSYQGDKTTNNFENVKIELPDLTGENVLLIEDIIDTGLTLNFLKNIIENKYKMKRFKIVTMLDKPSRRVVDLKSDYSGFEIEDKFVVGYGLDYNEKYRNLPFIGYFE